jgi:acyl carrier protein
MRRRSSDGRRRQRRRARSVGRRDDSRLSTDLDLDSLRRVELLGVIEEELGVFVDDDALEPEATVADLVALVEAARGRSAACRPGAGRCHRSSARVGLARRCC